MDWLQEKQLYDKNARLQASKLHSHRLAVAEQIGEHTLRMLHKKTLWQRIKRRKHKND